MSVYVLMNWGAWALSAIVFGWLLFDIIKTDKTYKDSVLLATIDQDEFEG